MPERSKNQEIPAFAKDGERFAKAECLLQEMTAILGHINFFSAQDLVVLSKYPQLMEKITLQLLSRNFQRDAGSIWSAEDFRKILEKYYEDLNRLLNQTH